MIDDGDVDIEELERLLLLEDSIKDDPAFLTEDPQPSTSGQKPANKSLIHSGDTDSSDDEDGKNFLACKYNEYGRDIQTMLKSKFAHEKDSQIERDVERANREADEAIKVSKQSQVIVDFVKEVLDAKQKKVDDVKAAETKAIRMNDIRKTEGWTVSSVYVDPVFGMRIIKPLISSNVLKERMQGRTSVPIMRIAKFLETADLKQDWVIAGAIVSKSPVKKSQKGTTYSIWKISDLKGDIKTISLFLFRNAHKELWKTQEGTILAILNPSVLDKRDNHDEACLSVDTEQKVMILGISKDMGKCRSKKKNGEPCTAIVNLSSCEYCVYHVKQEYGKASKRAEFQSGMLGKGLHDLRNKVLGKDQVFYGGQMFTAVRATKNAKQVAKDQKRLMQLSEYYQSPFHGETTSGVGNPNAVTYVNQRKELSASKLEGSTKQRHKDLERLARLGGDTSTLSPVSFNQPSSMLNSVSPSTIAHPSKPIANTLTSVVPEKFKNLQFSFEKNSPKLSKDSFSVDLSTPSAKSAALAKARALEILKKKPIEKSNPNFIKHRGTDNGKKRAIADLVINEPVTNVASKSENAKEPDAKKRKIDEEAIAKKDWEERIRKIIEKKSKHTDLLEERENEDQEKYFNNLEKKEAMEEKMMNTFKVACKAVICSKCKYMAFSASTQCKEEKHPLKVIDGEKRFFKCLDCGNRTATLFRIPKVSCKNCQSSRWERTSMMREKKIGVGAELSIRGDEETYIGSVSVRGGNINLLVPEEFV